MTTDGRLSVKHLLIDAGFPLTWVSKYTAIVSTIYHHDVMKGVGMRKDKRGAVYTDADAAGLLQVAQGLRDNPRAASLSASRTAPASGPESATARIMDRNVVSPGRSWTAAPDPSRHRNR